MCNAGIVPQTVFPYAAAMKSVRLSLSLLFFLVPAVTASAAESSSRPVVLSKNQPLRSGTVIREKREILVARGRSKQVNAKETSDVSTRYLQRVNLVHTRGGGGVSEIRVADFLTEWSHFAGPNPPPPNEQPSPLTSRTIRARKTGARWNYDLTQGKATPEERQTLDQLALAASLLDLFSVFMGNAPHKPGETWKTTLPAPRGKAAGYIVPKDIECTLVSVEDKADGPHATVRITGTVGLERPLDYGAHVDISFEATLVRRLSDMVDVSTQVKGGYVLKGEASILGVGKTQLDFDYPYTLSRTLTMEGK